MEQQFIIDTNAVIDYLGRKIPAEGMLFMNEVINNIPTISVITQIEILSFKTLPSADSLLQNFIDECFVIELNQEIVQKTIEIRQLHKVKIPDAIIAATALIHEKTLITRNISDFKKSENLKLLNPHDL